jgi:hypothetical protein
MSASSEDTTFRGLQEALSTLHNLGKSQRLINQVLEAAVKAEPLPQAVVLQIGCGAPPPAAGASSDTSSSAGMTETPEDRAKREKEEAEKKKLMAARQNMLGSIGLRRQPTGGRRAGLRTFWSK